MFLVHVEARLTWDKFIQINPVNMQDPIRIRSGPAGKHCPEAGRMVLAHQIVSGPDPFGQNLTQSART